MSEPLDFVYSVKFLCGFMPPNPNLSPFPVPHLPTAEPPVKPGNYATAINIHNPQAERVVFCKKAVLSGFLSREGRRPEPEQVFLGPPPERRISVKLEPDAALEIDCPDILTLLEQAPLPVPIWQFLFVKGFVVIQSPQELDVVAVYTGQGGQPDPAGTVPGRGDLTMDVEYITPKQIRGLPPCQS